MLPNFRAATQRAKIFFSLNCFDHDSYEGLLFVDKNCRNSSIAHLLLLIVPNSLMDSKTFQSIKYIS